MFSLNFPFLVSNIAIVLFFTLFCWKWPTRCRVFVELPVDQRQLDDADVKRHCARMLGYSRGYSESWLF